MTLKAFIDTHEVESEATHADDNPDIPDPSREMHHFLVTLRTERGTMEVPFSQGSAVEGEPDAAVVLDCLISDISLLEDEGEGDGVKLVVATGGAIEDTADVDRANRMAGRIKAHRAGLEHLLGADAYEHLRYHVERL